MNYYMAAMLPISFGEALERTEEALKQDGFGIRPLHGRPLTRGADLALPWDRKPPWTGWSRLRRDVSFPPKADISTDDPTRSQAC